MSVRVHAVGRTDVPPFVMPDRFRHEITYFAVDRPPTGAAAGPGEWWIDRGEAETIRDDGVIRLASPLDSAIRAEVELSEEQEAWLDWLFANDVWHVRLE